MKFLHVIPPHAVNAYEIIKFVKKNFPAEEHAFLVMQDRNWVINNCPRLLAFLDIYYLPEKKKLISIFTRLKTTLKWLDEAEHIVLHSVFSIHGKLFLPFFCRKKYAKKCIWMEIYSDILRWHQPGKGIFARVQNRLLENFLREIPLVGTKLLSDEIAYRQYIRGSAEFCLAPFPVVGEHDVNLAQELLQANGVNLEQIKFYDYAELMAECEERYQKYIENNKICDDKEPLHGEEGVCSVEGICEDEAVRADEVICSDDRCASYSYGNRLLMVEGDMFQSHNHLSLFTALKPLAREGLIAANLNHIGKYCYSGSASYRRIMCAAGKRTLGRKYTDFLRPNATREEFYKYISRVDGILLFGERTMNPQFIWFMLLMNKKVFLREKTPLYQYLKMNAVPVFPFHYLQVMSMEQFTRPIKTDNCQWIRTFVEEKNVVACWQELFDYAQEQRNEGQS